MKKPKNYKWQKNDGIGTMSRHLRSEHGLGPEGKGISSSRQAQLHGYASDMPDVGMPFVYNREIMITEFGKFVIADEFPFIFDESSNCEYFNKVALQPQYRRLLHDAITYRDVLTDTYNESRSDGRFITNDIWSSAKIIHDPNIHMVIFECTKIICTINTTSMANSDPSVKDLLDKMKVKWCAYYNKFPTIYAIAAILDPGVKLQGLTNLLTFYYEQLNVNFDGPSYVNKCKRFLERLCQDYGAVIQPQPIGSSMGASRFWILGPILKKQRPDGKKVICLDTPTRWNSTYKLLHDAIRYLDILTDMYNESRLDGQFITNDRWSLTKIIHDVLETFDYASHIFSYVYEPNIHMVILKCTKIICAIITTFMANPDRSVKDLLDKMKVRWCAYFKEFPTTYAIAAILDPGVKLQGLTNLLTFYYEQLNVYFDVSSYVNKCKRI
ncbi:Zinc finger BED domain-containing protein RICESLEEPER 3 [Bienertia sinuspersici]